MKTQNERTKTEETFTSIENLALEDVIGGCCQCNGTCGQGQEGGQAQRKGGLFGAGATTGGMQG